MTESEAREANYEYDLAIDLIKRIKTEETHERYIDRHKAFDLAIKALEKQYAKQIIRSIKKEEGNRVYHFCPCCHQWLTRMTKYCSNCGQKLDWSDEE